MTETMDRAINRGSLIRTAGAAGAGMALGSSFFGAAMARASGGVTKGDIDILIAAEIAEALAVTTYTNIINRAPFFKHLEAEQQVLAPPADVGEALAVELHAHLARIDRRRQPAVADVGTRHGAVSQARLQPAADRLDLGQLRHRRSVVREPVNHSAARRE